MYITGDPEGIPYSVFTEKLSYSPGIGEPAALKGNLQGVFSRRINEKDRLVYHIEDGRILYRRMPWPL